MTAGNCIWNSLANIWDDFLSGPQQSVEWANHLQGWQRGRIPMYDKGKEKKCTFVNTNLFFALILVPSMQVSFPPLLNMRIKKLKIPLTTSCSISLSCRCQQVQHHDTCSQESLASLFFFNSLLIHPLGTNLCHPIWNPKMNSWLLHGGYQKQKAEECSVRKETDIIVYYGFMPCFFFKSCSLDCNILQ